MSFHAGLTNFSREVRGEQDRIKMYTHEYERDMTNKEGPGPAAFQLNVVPRAAPGQKFCRAVRTLSNIKKTTPGPTKYNLVQSLRSMQKAMPRAPFGRASRVMDLTMFQEKNNYLVTRGIL